MSEQHLQPLGTLGMVARRMEVRERGMRQDVDLTISASSSMVRPFDVARPSR